MLSASVVIPSYGRPELLARALAALAAQDLPRERFEVVVVDDGGSPPAAPALRPFADRLRLKILRKPNGGLPSARNAGAKIAEGDVLVFLDDDIEAAPEFLQAHLAPHESGERLVVLGALPYPPDLERTAFLAYLERVKHYDLFLRYPDGDIPMPPLNGNSSIRRSEFVAAGGYDEAFAAYGGEDTEMGHRLKSRGLRFVYAPRAVGYHRHLKGFRDMRRDMVSSGRALVAIVRRYPELRERVNLDLVAGPFGRFTVSKVVRRLAFRLLDSVPGVVPAIELAIRMLERLGAKRLLYPFYLVAAHYYYGRGVRIEYERGDHACPDPDVSLV